MKIIDISGADLPGLSANLLEAGNLQVRNDAVVKGQLQVSSGINVGSSGIYSNGNIGLSGTLMLINDTLPSYSPPGTIQIYAEDVAVTSELKVRDEAGNITTLSPHNFSLIGESSEEMAWSYYSERNGKKINVDMLKSIRLLERLSGEKLVYVEDEEHTIIPSLDKAPFKKSTSGLLCEDKISRMEEIINRQSQEIIILETKIAQLATFVNNIEIPE